MAVMRVTAAMMVIMMMKMMIMAMVRGTNITTKDRIR